ncbi:MAG: ammonium transporter, partial [Chloroflexota bacterium]
MDTTSSLRDVLWVLIAAAMVLLMQGGFTLLESGLVRSKNSINVAIKNLVDFCLSGGFYWAIGFAFMFGQSFDGLGWIGSSGFFLSGELSPQLLAFFLFQLVFAGTATTIVSGAVAERMRFSGYLVVSMLIATIIYPVVGHWVWASLGNSTQPGWLEQMGFIDFAGSTVVHSVGGWVALAAVLVIGPRLGRFDTGDSEIRGHSLPLATFGVLILWFGWFGFNGGSTLGVTADIPIIVVNTLLSGAFGGLVLLLLTWLIMKRPLVEMVINGVLAGLVSITASANLVDPSAAIMIGIVGAVIAFVATLLLEKLHIDDVISAFPVHACAGVWGTLSIALFSDPASWGTNLSRFDQFLVQLTGVGATFAWSFGVGFGCLWVISRLIPLRVTEEDERLGLNVSEHGAKTELLTLLEEMEAQRLSGDISLRVTVEPHTEVGQIAEQYNRVLDSVSEMVTNTNAERDSLQHAIIKLLEEISDVGTGDLTVEAEVTEDVTGALADSFNFMIGQLREIIENVHRTTLQVNQSADTVKGNAVQLAERSELQATRLADTTTAVDEMAEKIQQVTENATTSAAVSVQARINAQQGATAVQDTIEGMIRIRNQVQETSKRIKRLGESSQEIGEIVQVIRDIAKRTSILSLNASLEAAAAGEAGRGFAVVAEDVKRLAERSATATHQISELVRSIQIETNAAVSAMEDSTREVVEGSQLANQAGRSLQDIETVFNQLANLITDISEKSEQQTLGSEVIVRSMTEITKITQLTATGTQETAHSIGELAYLTNELRDSVSAFRLPENGSTP